MPPRSKTDAPADAVANRVVDFQYIRGEDITPHPNNFRKHPAFQRQVFQGLVHELGVADVLLLYQSARYGGLTLINGHMRTSELPGHEWPCAITDLTDEEADVMLAAKDPLAALGQVDKAKWRELRDAAALTQRDWKTEALGTFFSEEQIRNLGAEPTALSADDLKKRYGDHDESHFWPNLTLRRIQPDVYEAFSRALLSCAGETDSERLAALVDRLLVDDQEAAS